MCSTTILYTYLPPTSVPGCIPTPPPCASAASHPDAADAASMKRSHFRAPTLASCRTPLLQARPSAIMLRLVLLAAASIAVWLVKPHSYRLGSFTLAADHLIILSGFLKWALPLWALVDLNSALNRLAENRWSWHSDKSRWAWDKEVAVVTGGSSGIGSCVVKRLVSYGVKVAVLDISPLEASFTNGACFPIHSILPHT